MRQRGWHSIVVGMKQEEFALRIDLQCVPFFLCLFTTLFKIDLGLSSISVPSSLHTSQRKRATFPAGSPWQNGKRAQIRFQIQITFFPTGKSIQGCGIDGTTVFHSFDQSAARDCHIFNTPNISVNCRRMNSTSSSSTICRISDLL